MSAENVEVDGSGVSVALITDDLAEAEREFQDSREHPNSYGHGYDVGFREGLRRYAPALIAALNLEDDLVTALKAASGYLMNARIDLETDTKRATAIRTIDGGLKIVRKALAKADDE